MKRSIFPPVLWGLFILILVTGYILGFVSGSVATDKNAKDARKFTCGRNAE